MNQYTDMQEMDNQQVIGSFFNKVYSYMTAGLVITAATIFFVTSSPGFIEMLYTNAFLFFGIIIGQLVLVFTLVRKINTFTYMQALGLFFLYSFLQGITMGAIMIQYPIGDIFYAFAVTVVAFAGLSLVGYATKKDLHVLGKVLVMGLFGLIGLLIANIFIQGDSFTLMVSAFGLVLFMGLTIYDTNKLKKIAVQCETQEQMQKAGIIGALQLYLDFINMFLFLLRIFSRR